MLPPLLPPPLPLRLSVRCTHNHYGVARDTAVWPPSTSLQRVALCGGVFERVGVAARLLLQQRLVTIGATPILAGYAPHGAEAALVTTPRSPTPCCPCSLRPLLLSPLLLCVSWLLLYRYVCRDCYVVCRCRRRWWWCCTGTPLPNTITYRYCLLPAYSALFHALLPVGTRIFCDRGVCV